MSGEIRSFFFTVVKLINEELLVEILKALYKRKIFVKLYKQSEQYENKLQ